MKNIQPRRRGFALMLVMLEMSLIAMLWGIAYRQLMTTMLFLKMPTLQTQSETSQSPYDAYKPLARALSLLETGEPPDGGSGVWTCNATVYVTTSQTTGPAYFIITFLKGTDTSSGQSWTVSSVQTTVTDATQAANWDNMPPTFGY